MIFLAIESSAEKKLSSEQILLWIEANIYQSAKSAFDHSTWSQMVLKQLVYNRSFYLQRNESVSFKIGILLAIIFIQVLKVGIDNKGIAKWAYYRTF